MLLDATRTVRELVIALPNATRVFEKLRIDYCCGGHQMLSEACRQAGLEVAEVARLLSQNEPTQMTSEIDNLQSMTLARLADYIVSKHHVFTRGELERLTALLEKVCSVHGANHAELLQIQSEFQTLRAELEPHMLKEERILFPHIAQLENSVFANSPPPFAPFGTVRNPITAMMKEHDAAGDILKTMRQLSGDFALPEDACFSYRTLYTALKELEGDLHQHIHLENNILFPQAIAIEQKIEPAMV